MVKSATSVDKIVLAFALLLGSGAYGAFYIKIFNMAPPLPKPIVEFPIYTIMIITAVLRFQNTIFGFLALSPKIPTMVLILLSYRWSLDPFATLQSAVFLIIIGAYFGAACFIFTWREFVDVIWLTITLCAMFSIILYLILPSVGQMQEGHSGALSGMWMEKNKAGEIAAFGGAIALARAAISPKKMAQSLMSYLLFFLMLLLSTSKTALIAFLAGSAIFVWVFLMRRNVIMFLITLTITIFIVLPSLYFVSLESETVLKLLGRNSTFSSRAQIWEALEFSIDGRPRFGHGYAAYWSPNYDFGTRHYVFKDLGFKAHSAHNSWLEIELALGSVGRNLMFFEIALTLFLSLIKIRSSKGAYIAIPAIVIALIISKFESSLALIGLMTILMTVVLGKTIRPTPRIDQQSGLAEFWHDISSGAFDRMHSTSDNQADKLSGRRTGDSTHTHYPQPYMPPPTYTY